MAYPKSWKPQPGEILSGTLVEYQKAKSKHGDAIVAIIRPEQGGLVGIWLSTVLLRMFKKTRPAPREIIAVQYLGQVEGEAHTYRDYRLALKRNGDRLDFSDQDETQGRAAAFDRDRSPDGASTEPDPF